MKNSKSILLNKLRADFKKDARIKECFHFDHQSCSKNIISAHSIQKSKVLNLLESDVEGNKAVFSFLELEYNNHGIPVGFKPLGKKQASTFFGFCNFHDTSLFSAIENFPVDLNNDEHCFLLSYRAFAKDYHSKKETLQGYQTNQFYAKNENQELKTGMIDGSILGLRDCEISKTRFNELLKLRQFAALEYLTYEVDYQVPIACSASITPEFSLSGKTLNLSMDPDILYEYVNVIVQPTEENRTLVVLSCLPEHQKSVQFLDEVNDLNDLRLQQTISSILIGYIENTFISPELWLKLGSKYGGQLLKELMLSSPPHRAALGHFFQSKINFFERRFKKNATQQWL